MNYGCLGGEYNYRSVALYCLSLNTSHSLMCINSKILFVFYLHHFCTFHGFKHSQAGVTTSPDVLNCYDLVTHHSRAIVGGAQCKDLGQFTGCYIYDDYNPSH